SRRSVSRYRMFRSKVRRRSGCASSNHASRSQAIIGVQMASAYVGTSLMPPLFGLISGFAGVGLLPFYLLALLILMAVMHEKMLKAVKKAKTAGSV
ncbi:MAG: hypothetical protein IIT84_06620, partial [Oscillospiraceae bacterium]|nr:hypothetical protein [Oscillospiraceae bacterium]